MEITARLHSSGATGRIVDAKKTAEMSEAAKGQCVLDEGSYFTTASTDRRHCIPRCSGRRSKSVI